MTDQTHTLFVQQEYRFTDTVTAPAVKARNNTAREVEIPTQLDEATATALAVKILADGEQPRVFSITLKGQYDRTELVGGVPTRVFNDPQLATDGKTRKLAGIVLDYQRDVHTLTVRG